MSVKTAMVNGVEVFGVGDKFYGDYIVVTWVDDKAWYYGSYKTLERAEQAVSEYTENREVIYNM